MSSAISETMPFIFNGGLFSTHSTDANIVSDIFGYLRPKINQREWQ